MKTNNLLLSFSGGKTSAFMVKYMLDNFSNVYNMRVVFANTGLEHPKTFEFIRDCDINFNFKTEWIELTNPDPNQRVFQPKIINFCTASRNAEPFILLVHKLGIPNISAPFCSRELKSYIIRRHLKLTGWIHYSSAIGIRQDEIDRISSTAKLRNLIYPLISHPVFINQAFINDFWNKQIFNLNIPHHLGNCRFCFKKSFSNLMKSFVDDSPGFQFWELMEKIALPNKHKFIFRGNNDCASIKHMSMLSQSQLNLLADFFTSNGCSESCEM